MSSIEQDFSEDEYFGNVRLKDTDVLDMGADVILSMKNLHKTYLLGLEGVPALRGVSLTVRKGEFVCIFGTSGGGKTTMLNIIGPIDKPSKGEMNLCGKLINQNTDDKVLAMLRLEKIGFVFQTFNLLSALTALENVEMPMILSGKLSTSERRERAIGLLTKVGMKERLDHIPAQLSGGEQQRVTIARAMANSPDILLLDEPTGDLDTVNTAIVLKLLLDLNKNDGITLVMVTHDVGLKMLADRVVWMRDGKIQRIEIISSSAREEAQGKLDIELDRIQKQRQGQVERAPITTVRRSRAAYAHMVGKKHQQSSPSSSSPSSSSSSKLPSPKTNGVSVHNHNENYSSLAPLSSEAVLDNEPIFNEEKKERDMENNHNNNNHNNNHNKIPEESSDPNTINLLPGQTSYVL